MFSFFSDLSTNAAIIKSMLAANNTVQKTAAAVARHMEGWKKYAVVWRMDRQGLISRLQARGLTAQALEDKVAKYHRLAEEVWGAGREADIGFARICSSPLAGGIRREAHAWVEGLLGIGRQADAPALAALQGQVAGLRALAGLNPQAAEGGEQQLAQDGERQPGQDGERQPAQGGERQPVQGGEQQPAQGGGQAEDVAAKVLAGAQAARADCGALVLRVEARGQYLSPGVGAHQADQEAVQAVGQALQELVAWAEQRQHTAGEGGSGTPAS